MLVSNIETKGQKKAVAPSSKVNKLIVLWYSDDQMVAEPVALMYTEVSMQYKLFDEVSVIIGGPSAKLVSENNQIQTKIKEMIVLGIKVNTCVTCSNLYGVTDQLKALGINTYIMGIPLINALKAEDTAVLIF